MLVASTLYCDFGLSFTALVALENNLRPAEVLRRDGTEKSRLRCVVCHLRRGMDAVQVSLSVSHSSRMMNSCRDRRDDCEDFRGSSIVLVGERACGSGLRSSPISSVIVGGGREVGGGGGGGTSAIEGALVDANSSGT